ncbi:MAG: hypothetical protein H5T86_07385, partial [Armatimonadetes bacterium]|nr:hypothetical protein [Armatimonadota bacterium]
MRTGRQCSVLVATAAVLLAGPSIPVSQPALACDAPVYEYALQNWEPDPYHAYYFFKGRADAQDTEANKLLEKVA